jgi:7,8-dihydroneopterin aldolase/epimerase/oxygenase
MDKIIIKDLAVWYCVGVPDDERSRPQRLLLTVELEHDFCRALLTDDVRHTIDYSAVAQRLAHFGDGRNWKLLETLAANVAEALLADFKPLSVTITVKKFVIPEAQYVSVCMTRTGSLGPAQARPKPNQ